ncbi:MULTISPECIES: formate/nitrite transporter family protein [unclassified Caballeronia]|uniref:formate/nitrite transporter family protein n=1 Tax=unclassified Caballeronia TaxID=2646786 RepID=UPI0028676EB2|nr:MULTISPECIES: formate/nitrite transporter family protein [unclassified Caballeronia]MDR5739640.1 formate/nitrite transporter family protein [Caballeronia sp. LZ016]MDR5808107.1 formate/nitrite transporter family protein [Caballeronia sp. LZ019]
MAEPDKNPSAGKESPHLDRDEREQAAEHSTPHALVIHEIVREEGEAAMERTFAALMWSALAAGLSMGFSFLVQSILESELPDTSWRSLVASFGYTIGFVFVILGRQQLFTESTLTAVLPVLVRRDLKTLGKTFRLWGIVIFFNLIGTVIFAGLLQIPGVFSPEVTEALAKVAKAPFSGDFGVTVVRAMFAGWLIALMVWLLPSARSARLLTILLVTYTVAVSKLSHVIAGSVESAYAVMTGAHSVSDYFLVFLLPTFIGNVIGGVSLVAIVNHAAIAPEINGSSHHAD